MQAQQTDMQAPRPAAMMVEPPAFRENWKKILASANNDEMKFVRVIDKVANSTNSKILVRSWVDLPDGFYHISTQNELFPTKVYGWMSYPDVEQVRPPLDKIKPLCGVTRDAVNAFIALCDAARQSRAEILVDARGMCWVQNSAHHVEYPMGITGEGFIFNPAHLKLALVEMLRYDSVGLWKEERLDYGQTPLIFGLDWARCSLILPSTSRY